LPVDGLKSRGFVTVVTTEDRPCVAIMCENLGAAQQYSPVSQSPDEHEKHMPSDHP
jgi:hypothetical protein